MQIVNTATKLRHTLRPRTPRTPLAWYACGPTVYAPAHVGHARSAVSQDALRRTLAAEFGVRAELVQGVTDVDDKIVAAAAAAGTSVRDEASRWEGEWWAAMARLGVAAPTAVARVSEHGPAMDWLVAELLRKGVAREVPDGVRFDAAAYRAAGHEYPSVFREAAGGEGAKDFALWKTTPANAPVRMLSISIPLAMRLTVWKGSRESAFWWGRPGWHLECTAMAHAILQRPLDLHTGGVDLCFPHHENEVAQAHGAGLGSAAEPWCAAWAHYGHVRVKGQKMSKSLKNFTTVDEWLDAPGASPRLFRLFSLLHHYAAPLEMSVEEEVLREARALDARFQRAAATLALVPDVTRHAGTPWGDAERQLHHLGVAAEADWRARLASDFDTPRAISSMAKLASAAAAYSGGQWGLVATTRALVLDKLAVLGLDYTSPAPQAHGLARSVDALVDFRSRVREVARAEKNGALFQLCDDARDAAQDAGIALVDNGTDAGTWHTS